MLLDAYAAEQLRLLKARGTLVWSLAPIPLVYLGYALFLHWGFHQQAARTGTQALLSASGPIDLIHGAVQALGGAHYVMNIPFLLVAGCAVFGSDYRWETWRLITPRNSRNNLMLAKLALFGVLAAVSLALFVVLAFVGGLFGSALNRVPVVLAQDLGSALPRLAMMFGLSWLELMVFGAAAACLAVFTRSQFAAFFLTLVWAVGQGIWQLTLQPPDPANPPLKYLAILPGYAADFLKAVIRAGEMAPETHSVWPALGFLLFWARGLGVVTVLAFGRQDLTRE